MTVCVAAMSQGVIFAASDRLITAGDIEFEANESKITTLTNSIVIMVAGDTGIGAEIISRMRIDIQAYIGVSPEIPLAVADAVRLYQRYYGEVKSERAEAELLFPIGQSRSTLTELRPEVVELLSGQMQRYEMRRVEVIIAGVDATGPHLYKVWDGDVRCEDIFGFVAIGEGANHAESQFMKWPLLWNTDPGQTLFMTFLAKKRGELAPGVGKSTDMITIGPQLYSLDLVLVEARLLLEKLYATVQKDEERYARKASNQMRKFTDALTARNAGPTTQEA